MGPTHDQSSPRSTQGVRRRPGPRGRRCLLKGCERWFVPARPQARYCGPACQAAAARWRRWKAQQRYRQTARGRACRCAQSRRHRVRRRSGSRDRGGASPSSRPRVGHHPARNLHVRATGLAATSPLRAAVGLRCSDSAGCLVGAPSNGSLSANAAGSAAGGRMRAAARAGVSSERSVLRGRGSARTVARSPPEKRGGRTRVVGVPVASLR